jgi:hypothetical protein
MCDAGSPRDLRMVNEVTLNLILCNPYRFRLPEIYKTFSVQVGVASKLSFGIPDILPVCRLEVYQKGSP